MYVLEGRAGDRIRVGLGALQGTEAGVDVRLRLLDPQGKEVAEDSTSCFGSIYCFLFLPELKDVALPQDGLYSLLVEGGNTGVAGSTYVLNVSPNLTAVESLPRIGFGEGIEGRLENNGETDVYVLEGRAGDRIRVGLGAIEVPGAGVPVRLRLLDPQGKEVAEDSLSNFGNPYGYAFRTELKDVVLPQDGLYSLLVEGGNTGVASSTYVLNVSPNLTAVESLPRIGFGEGIEGRLENNGETDVYVLEGRAGDRIGVGLVALQVPEAGVPVRLRLLDPQGNEVAEASTSCFGSIYCGGAPELKDMVLPQDGLYSLLVEGGNKSGVAGSTYRLTLERIP